MYVQDGHFSGKHNSTRTKLKEQKKAITNTLQKSWRKGKKRKFVGNLSRHAIKLSLVFCSSLSPSRCGTVTSSPESSLVPPFSSSFSWPKPWKKRCRLTCDPETGHIYPFPPIKRKKIIFLAHSPSLFCHILGGPLPAPSLDRLRLGPDAPRLPSLLVHHQVVHGKNKI